MGDVVPFRGKRRWTRPEDYGHYPGSPANGGGDGGSGPPAPKRPKTGKSRITPVRAWIVLVVILVGYVFYDPALVDPPGWLSSKPEKVAATFTRCDESRSPNCVIDGDTFRLGDRRIRLIGIDAPETHPASCEAEAKMGERATAELQRLLNQGPFTMVGRIDDPTDKYGRDLRALSRVTKDGKVQSIGQAMIASGTVRRYAGDFRKSWCSKTPD